MKKFPEIFALFAISTTACLSTSARAEEPVAKVPPPSYSVGGVSMGGQVASNNSGGTSGGLAAQVGYRKLSIGEPSDGPYTNTGYPTHALEADARYNMIGASKQGMTTGLQARVAGFVGGTLLGRFEQGCDFYGGAGGIGEAGLHLNRPGETSVRANIGPETGLMCQLGQVMFQVSPTASVGYTGVNKSADLSSRTQGTDENFLRLGGRARLVIDDKAAISAEGLATPRMPGSAGYTSTEGSVNAQVKVDKWVFGGYAKGVQLQAQDPGLPTFRGGEAGLLVGRAF